MHAYNTVVPSLVSQAMALADEMQFANSCSADTGRLLRLLASHLTKGTIAEIGTGCGVGTAWMVSALSPSVHLYSVDLDKERALAATKLFSKYSQVTILTGAWQQLAAFGPFDLVFVDVGDAKVAGAEDVLNLLRVGGMVVLDDLTPEELWPPEWQGKPDPAREFWLNNPGLAAVELRTGVDAVVILATKLG